MDGSSLCSCIACDKPMPRIRKKETQESLGLVGETAVYPDAGARRRKPRQHFETRLRDLQIVAASLDPDVRPPELVRRQTDGARPGKRVEYDVPRSRSQHLGHPAWILPGGQRMLGPIPRVR